MAGAPMPEGGKIAVVLCALGGPDGPEAVEPFLFNLFNDRAIIALPGVLRWPFAKLIARRRAPIAREIYGRIGGASPLRPNTEAQGAALAAAVQDLSPVRSFIAMRYWHPFSEAAAAAVKEWGAERVVLLPLYPQYSTTTSASSRQAWQEAAARAGLTAPTTFVCCYPREAGFVKALAESVSAALEQVDAAGNAERPPRVLFSAHGLPRRTVERGDPYRWQVEQSCAATVLAIGRRGLDWRVCYQSRVGPLEWIGPATSDEIAAAGADGVPLVVAPIAFVSEHSETLEELDMKYRELARRTGVPVYIRVPTVSTAPPFIAGLAGLVRRALADGSAICPGDGMRICPAAATQCPMKASGTEA
ncbi:MAG: ferrochelatase [Alphaproteobacteria bacterium]